MSLNPVPDLRPDMLAEVLPGSWHVRASNFPMWLSERRIDPVFSYALLSTAPLVLSDDVSWRTPEGETRHIVGVGRLVGSSFTWRGSGLLRVLSSHWSVEGICPDGNLLSIRFGKSLLSPAGIDIIERVGAGSSEPRSLVAASSASFGLTPEDFASLTWLAPSS